MFRVGIVGANLYGKIYGQAFTRQSRTEVVGLASAQGDYDNDIAAQLGVKSYDSLPQMLDEAKIDILCICSTTAEHARHTQMAAEAGANVLCDRPIAMTLDEAAQMMSAIEKAKTILMVGHVLRFWPEYVMAQELLASGELGRVLSVTTSRVSGTLSPPWQSRLLDPELGFGGLEALIHDVDFLEWILGKPVSVYAHGIKAASGGWGQMQSLLEYADGVQAQSESSYLVPLTFPLSMYLRVLAEKGTLVFDFRGALSDRGTSTRNLVVTKTDGIPEVLEVPAGDAYASLVTHFVDCIETGQQPKLGSAEQSASALRTLLDMKRSADRGAIFRINND